MTIVLTLPGQGSQFPSMGAFLHDSDAVFRTAFEEFLDALGPRSAALVHVWRSGTRAELARGAVSQPLLFAVGYAAGRSVLARTGDVEVVLLGHSVGELAAATLAGVLDPGLAGELLRCRADLLATAPAGGMVGCRARPEAVERCLRAAGVPGCIAAENALDQCVVSTDQESVGDVVTALRRDGIACMRVAATEPFHSPILGPVAHQFGAFLEERRERLGRPRRPLMSAYSAEPVDDAAAADPTFWTRQIAEPVRFREALAHVDRPGTLIVETGPGTTLTTAARTLGHVRAGSSRAVAALPAPDGGRRAWDDAMRLVDQHLAEGSTAAPFNVFPAGRGAR